LISDLMIMGSGEVLSDMPWFGLLHRWRASTCLWHHVSKRPFPPIDDAACPGQGSSEHHRRLEGHGQAPGLNNGNSVCSLRKAEVSVVETGPFLCSNSSFPCSLLSSTAFARTRPCENTQAHIEGSSTKRALAAIDSDVRLRALLGPLLEPPENAAAEEFVFAAAERAFDGRVRVAAEELARDGYSASSPPPWLVPECFDYPPPLGLGFKTPFGN